MPAPKDKSLLRNLGEFFGHIAHGIKTDPARPRTVTKKTIEHESRDTPQGKVVGLPQQQPAAKQPCRPMALPSAMPGAKASAVFHQGNL